MEVVGGIMEKYRNRKKEMIDIIKREEKRGKEVVGIWKEDFIMEEEGVIEERNWWVRWFNRDDLIEILEGYNEDKKRILNIRGRNYKCDGGIGDEEMEI